MVAFFFLSFGYIGLQFLLTPVRIKTVTSILTTEQYADLNMVMMNISFIGVMLSLGSYEYLLRMLPGKTEAQQLGIIRVFIQFFGGVNLVGAVIGVANPLQPPCPNSDALAYSTSTGCLPARFRASSSL